MKTSNRQRKPSIALNVLAVVVAINVAGAAVYLLVMRHKQGDAGQASGSTPGAPGEPTPDVSRALRAAGLAALESGRYEEAVKRFTEAAKSSKASADLPQLMKIAMELRDRAGTTPKPEATTAVATTTTTPDKGKDKDDGKAAAADDDDDDKGKVEETKPAPVVSTSKISASERKRLEREAAQRERDRERERQQRRVAQQSSQRAASKPEPTETEQPAPTPQPGTIIVSSTPSGLTVQLDGKTLDQTPLRVTAEPGAHEIQLLHNNTVVFNRRLNVVPSSVQSLDPDVSAQVAVAHAASCLGDDQRWRLAARGSERCPAAGEQRHADAATDSDEAA